MEGKLQVLGVNSGDEVQLEDMSRQISAAEAQAPVLQPPASFLFRESLIADDAGGLSDAAEHPEVFLSLGPIDALGGHLVASADVMNEEGRIADLHQWVVDLE